MTEESEIKDESLESENSVGDPVENLGAGGQLRAAREGLGLTQAQVSAQTRISERHIVNIEDGSFEKLPSRMYAIGFAKNIAKVVGLDQNDIGALVREEYGDGDVAATAESDFVPGDPARSPSRFLVWFSLAAIVLLLAGLFATSKQVFWPSVSLPSLIQSDDEEGEEAAIDEDGGEQAAAPVPSGQVIFTAQDAVWVRFYEEGGDRLKEGEMAKGESFAIPVDATGPLLITGRPDLLTITIGGQDVPKISEDVVTVSDVPISAQALLARETDEQEEPQSSEE